MISYNMEDDLFMNKDNMTLKIFSELNFDRQDMKKIYFSK